jgi:hypothetical protein
MGNQINAHSKSLIESHLSPSEKSIANYDKIKLLSKLEEFTNSHITEKKANNPYKREKVSQNM